VLSYVIFELIWEFCGLSRTIGEYIFTAVGFLMTIITGYFIALLLPQKIPLTGFIIAGVITIHIGALITMAIIQGVYKTDYFITYVPVHSAAVIELIIFTSGLAYKSRMNEQIKVKSQRALIEQLEKNLKLEQQIQHTQNLLARQMHDELGSTISSIKIYTELANKNLTDANRNVSSYIQKAHTLSVQLMDYMSDMLWTINPNNQGNEKLLQRIREYEREYLSHLDIKIDSIEIDLVSTELTTGLRCDLLVLSRSYFKMIEPETRQSIDYRLIATPTFIRLTLSNVIKQDKNSKFNELIAKHNGSITYENDALIINLPITIISDTPV
jgi:signal transduction histidine kinase